MLDVIAAQNGQDADDASLDEIRESALREGHTDIVTFIDQLPDDGTLPENEEVMLPFYEEDRADAFTLGIAIGAVLERNYEADE